MGLAAQELAFYNNDKSRLICGDAPQYLVIEKGPDGTLQSKEYPYINENTIAFIGATSSVCSAYAGLYGRTELDEGINIPRITRELAGSTKGDFSSFKTQGEHELFSGQADGASRRICIPTADGSLFEKRVVNTSIGSSCISAATIQQVYNFVSDYEKTPDLTMYHFRCENVTLSGALAKQLDTKKVLASDHEFTHSKKFPAIKRTFPGMSLTILLFSKGRIVVIGSADIDLIFRLLNDTIRIIIPYFIVDKDSVVDVVDIEAIYATYKRDHASL